MEFILQDGLYSLVKQYVEPEMLIFIPVLLFIGWMMKTTPNVPDWVIPYVNTVIAIAGGVILAATTIDGIIQGIIMSATTTLLYNLYKQWRKRNE